jgi:hypothetical protein
LKYINSIKTNACSARGEDGNDADGCFAVFSLSGAKEMDAGHISNSLLRKRFKRLENGWAVGIKYS